LVLDRELNKIYCPCHNHRQHYSVGDLPLTIPTDFIRQYFTESSKIFTAHATIIDGLAIDDVLVEIQMKKLRQ
jgi:hypothetical protein